MLKTYAGFEFIMIVKKRFPVFVLYSQRWEQSRVHALQQYSAHSPAQQRPLHPDPGPRGPPRAGGGEGRPHPFLQPRLHQTDQTVCSALLQQLTEKWGDYCLSCVLLWSKVKIKTNPQQCPWKYCLGLETLLVTTKNCLLTIQNIAITQGQCWGSYFTKSNALRYSLKSN